MAVELNVVRDRGPGRGARRAAEGPGRMLPRVVEPFEVRVARSIEEFDRREWDALFPNELETWGYLRALERARLEGCDLVYFAVRSGGRLVAAAPGFVGRRVLAEPWRAAARGQWRRSRGRRLVLGSPLSDLRRVGIAPGVDARERMKLVGLTLRAARDEAARMGVSCALPGEVDTGQSQPLRLFRSSTWFETGRRKELTPLSLPQWSFADYLSCIEEPLRGRLLRVCAQAGPYERDWHVDLGRDLAPILALCADAGLEELGQAFFENLLGPEVCASCLVVRLDGKVAGFSLVLHDARVLREKLTIVSRRVKGPLVRALIWLETIRFSLEAGIGRFESPSELSLAVAGPRAQNPSTGSSLSTVPSAAVPPERSSVAT
ncbi:MAG TPA: hypothetical protein VL131_10380 [Gammaproteobacteria bacterium]|nr:hypothetical protein [Gammaproteobacteria bacterium]